MQDYEADRWRIVSTKVGVGFSAAACKAKAAELHPDVYEDDPEPDAGLEEAGGEDEGEENVGKSEEEVGEEIEEERQREEKREEEYKRQQQQSLGYTQSIEEQQTVGGDGKDEEKDSDGEGTSEAIFEVDDTG